MLKFFNKYWVRENCIFNLYKELYGDSCSVKFKSSAAICVEGGRLKRIVRKALPSLVSIALHT
jgi:hypothetical protein